MNCTYLSYSQTGYFSNLVVDYLNEAADIKPFYTYAPDAEGIKNAIKARRQCPVDRQVLVSTLKQQYKDLAHDKAVAKNIELLADENTFTICTAHQPNLLTGYLYFIYKIVHAIKLSAELMKTCPDCNFVPVYYMGSEDNDLDELGRFNYSDRKFVWDAEGQTGAVGRMKTASLKPLLDELCKLLGPPGDNCSNLYKILSNAYLQHDTISDATQYLVNELFGRYGLVVLNPDEAAFKKAFIAVMKDDLLNHTAHDVVVEQAEKLERHYKAQAYPRPINLFYLKDNVRERIEKQKDNWQVLNTDISFSREELEKELDAHPERFSPNVILRGLFQETILPNVVFIGGGAEVAYWLQLKTLFAHYNVFYPVIMMRQCILWAEAKQVKARKQLELSVEDIFKDEVTLLRKYVTAHSNDDWQTNEEQKSFEGLMDQLKRKAVAVDPTLKSSSEAALTKIRYQLQVLEKKMLKAEKRKMQDVLNKVASLKRELFPNNGLQERIENFLEYYLKYGNEYFDLLYNNIEPLRNEFLVIENEKL